MFLDDAHVTSGVCYKTLTNCQIRELSFALTKHSAQAETLDMKIAIDTYITSSKCPSAVTGALLTFMQVHTSVYEGARQRETNRLVQTGRGEGKSSGVGEGAGG
jgi:hypothetical protein